MESKNTTRSRYVRETLVAPPHQNARPNTGAGRRHGGNMNTAPGQISRDAHMKTTGEPSLDYINIAQQNRCDVANSEESQGFTFGINNGDDDSEADEDRGITGEGDSMNKDDGDMRAFVH